MNIAIILAAGKSKRMNGVDKIFHEVKGEPLIFYTIKIFENHPEIGKIILVTRKNNFRKISDLIRKYGFKKVGSVIEGGRERQDSAFNGFKAVVDLGAEKNDLILFHNGANPLVSSKEISNLIKAAKKFGAALLGQPAKDTIKEIDENGFVARTISREKIFLAQTPQAIKYQLVEKAFENANQKKFRSTDEVSLVERLGKKVKILPCSHKNIKITTREDLNIIQLFL